MLVQSHFLKSDPNQSKHTESQRMSQGRSSREVCVTTVKCSPVLRYLRNVKSSVK
ncbi:unnamed protein product [Brassica oleracea var. botrytis]